MIDNRLRIEKQIMLGRQAIRNFHKNKNGIVSQETEQRQTNKTENDQTTANPVSPSDPEIPLSVDTDAEAAFARRSPNLKRGVTPQNAGSSRGERGASSVRRLTRDLERKPLAAANEQRHAMDISPGPKTPNSDPHPSGFFARLRANSLSRLPLPFSYDRSKQSQVAGNGQDMLNSSDSSSEGDYSWDEDHDMGR